MESLVSAARISSSSSSFPPLSIFHPKRTSLIIRPFPLRFSSKNEEDRCDFRADTEDTSSVPFSKNHACPRLPKNEAIDLVLSAAVGKGWVTGSGMEGPASPESDSIVDRPVSTFPWSLFTKSPRRRMRVSFTCNVCGQRTTRAINPHAYTDGTVFVQCCGCNVFHKLVDNLNLFHEMKCYVNPSFWYQKGKLNLNFLDEGVDDDDDDVGNVFPLV